MWIRTAFGEDSETEECDNACENYSEKENDEHCESDKLDDSKFWFKLELWTFWNRKIL